MKCLVCEIWFTCGFLIYLNTACSQFLHCEYVYWLMYISSHSSVAPRVILALIPSEISEPLVTSRKTSSQNSFCTPEAPAYLKCKYIPWVKKNRDKIWCDNMLGSSVFLWRHPRPILGAGPHRPSELVKTLLIVISVMHEPCNLTWVA